MRRVSPDGDPGGVTRLIEGHAAAQRRPLRRPTRLLLRGGGGPAVVVAALRPLPRLHRPTRRGGSASADGGVGVREPWSETLRRAAFRGGGCVPSSEPPPADVTLR